jgi:hypothetical protein
MNTDYTHICFILDRSGSMASQADDAIGGFNTLIESQQKLTGKCTFSLILFDDRYEQPYDFTPIQMVAKLTNDTFVPRGGTALLDAVGRAMNETGVALAALPENERPSKVMIAVLTDGQENQSRKFSASQIKDMIEHQSTKYAWQITFLSSDIQAYEQALSYGFSLGNTRSANSIGSAMKGFVLNAERTRGMSREVYTASASCAFDETGVDEVLDKDAPSGPVPSTNSSKSWTRTR